ncbi:MAG: thioredoxin family protein [bacterium]|nr:thioredoxin family protein [bacterium]
MEIKTIYEFGLTYAKYRALIDQLVLQGHTTGFAQSEQLLKYTKLNIQRMNRLDKTIQISSDLIPNFTRIKRTQKWLLIGDAWCGDCAQIIPILNKLADVSNGKIEFRIISRDTFPELIENFQTNGTKSIPKLIVINSESNEVCTTWGPRPMAAQAIMLNWKENKSTISWDEFENDLHLWYARDKGQTIISEIATLIQKCETKIPLLQ